MLHIYERAEKVSEPEIFGRDEIEKISYLDIYKSNYAFLSDSTHSSGTFFTNTPPDIFTVISIISHLLAQDIFSRITKIVAKTFYIDKTFQDFDLKLAEVSGYTILKLKELAESL
ncbi:MAG: hypothetical protein H8E87_07415 [FCB group bacterium]|nr:hypothetical protein [FCB group bacterium]